MKKYLFLCIGLTMLFACSSDSDELIKEVSVTLKFTQNWDGADVTKSDFSKTEFTNKLGTKLTIEQLRYLISRVALVDGKDNVTLFDGYNLVDLSKEESLTFNLPKKVSEGSYKLSFVFGFNNEDNKTNAYQDLNTASWNVPAMLGGGYHFMQLDGKYTSTDLTKKPYNYHAIKAYNTSTSESEDTFFIVDLGTISLTNNSTIEIKMNIAQWFKNPNDWNLNDLDVSLMMNFDAQKQMHSNGKSGVFSLGTITQ
ncbi:MbnP family protein [uncultured Tenacibaculum sp.]|uniref:MbnP family protein n=1 Tax=uncultured Tenacibaculum sp. TaxID=174713 RepID=UPI0026162804|nr:MbnP family protein [uncultured Tenacibaculum sp.]